MPQRPASEVAVAMTHSLISLCPGAACQEHTARDEETH
jgi:hypothetical protein